VHDITSATSTQNLLEIRALRLSLENAGTPPLEIRYLARNAAAISLCFAYLTLDFELFRNADQQIFTDPYLFITASFTQRALFAYLVGVLTFAINLCSDLNRPFEGYFRLESGTVVATLLQIRKSCAKILKLTLDDGLYSKGAANLQRCQSE